MQHGEEGAVTPSLKQVGNDCSSIESQGITCPGGFVGNLSRGKFQQHSVCIFLFATSGFVSSNRVAAHQFRYLMES